MNKILQGNCIEEMRKLWENSVDLIATDPPYGIGFMGKEWDTFKPDSVSAGVARSSRKDKTLKTPETRDKGSAAMEAARYDHTPAGARKFREWFYGVSVEMLRVLKPGGFAFVCIGARQDSVSAAITAMTEAGFKTDFTSLFWTYANGFPKASNIGKLMDKRNGTEREVIGLSGRTIGKNPKATSYQGTPTFAETAKGREKSKYATKGKSFLEGSYGGFQPKPAVEVIIVAMKPLSEKTFVDQALKNGKGVTWLDDCRVPTGEVMAARVGLKSTGGIMNITAERREPFMQDTRGRFPANLLVSDNVLGDHSRFFALPFLIVPKASKGEKNDGLVDRESATVSDGRPIAIDNAFQRGKTGRKNIHPTVKPLKLMSYLITLGSREGDVVLDPFVGSGTTCIAAKQLNRKYIGIDQEKEYVEIAEARILAIPNTLFG